MDYQVVVSIGLPGLLVAWLDTILVCFAGICICHKLLSMSMRDSVIVAGAVSVGGSSVAASLASCMSNNTGDENGSGGNGYVTVASNIGSSSRVNKDFTVKIIIAVMGIFNTPLIPIMPLMTKWLNINPYVAGAWIGGSLDSTGQVIASARMGSDALLKTALIIKVAQNVLLGPLCMVTAAFYHRSFQPLTFLNGFPPFIFGFLITSGITTLLLHSGDYWGSENVKEYLLDNVWSMCDWFFLLGFVIIGLEIDFKARRSREDKMIVLAFLCIQALDLCTTFGWSYFAFNGRDCSDDDDNMA